MLPTIISALLYIIAFPVTAYDVSPWPLIWFALTPFFLFIERDGPLAGKFLAGAVWGAVMSLGMGYWIAYAMIVQYGISIPVTILFMSAGLMLPHGIIYGIVAVMYRFLKDNVPVSMTGPGFHLLAVPSLWVVAEFSREIIPLLVPWGLAGYALQPFNLYMQAADVAGIYGISFLVVMMNAVMTYLLRQFMNDRGRGGSVPRDMIPRIKTLVARNRVPAAAMALIVLVPVTYGVVRRDLVQRTVCQGAASAMTRNAVVVQANFNQEERWKSAGFIERVNVCLGLTGRCAGGTGDDVPGPEGPRGIVLWPETVLNAGGMVNSKLFSFIHSRMGGQELLVAGGVRRSIGTNGVYNTAYMIDGKDDTLFYDKNILLPYAETAPVGPLFGNFYSAPAEFLEGSTPPAARTSIGVIGLSICFEALYPWYARRAVKDGAGVLVNISNDGWFGRTSEPALHLRQASVRAIENRRYLIRSSNNGYSAIVDPTGRMPHRSGLYTAECLRGDFQMLKVNTIYTVIGDWIIYGAVLVLAGLMVAVIVGNR